jgi:3-hydroxyisobutyrate dehydrogenase-like beta-hydroxyacid dehydrogenase
VSPHTIEDLAHQFASDKIGILDAAMSGGERAAESGCLTLMAGGVERNFEERLGPVFSAYATSTLWLGRLGTGMTAKLINNMLLHSSRLALYEAFFLSGVANIDFESVLQVVRKSTGQSWIADNWGELDRQIVETGLPSSSFLLQMQKDLGLYLNLCQNKGFTPCMATLVESVLPLIVAHGDWPVKAGS